jgi:hypothetical protein
MKKSRFSEEQIAMALRQAEAGTPMVDFLKDNKLGDRVDVLISHRGVLRGLDVSSRRNPSGALKSSLSRTQRRRRPLSSRIGCRGSYSPITQRVKAEFDWSSFGVGLKD